MEYFLLTSRNVGVRSKPPRNRRMGIVSPVDTRSVTGMACPYPEAGTVPLDGEPSMI